MSVPDYELVRGSYKNLTLRLVGPEGRLRVTCPWFFPQFAVDRFVAERTDWIQQKKRAIAEQSSLRLDSPTTIPSPLWVWGRPYEVVTVSPGKLPRVCLEESTARVTLYVPATWNTSQRLRALSRWRIDEVTRALRPLIEHWCQKTGLQVASWSVKTMKSRWGSCRPEQKMLVFNAHLAAYPRECLEHVVVHELAHLIEPLHNHRFHSLVESWLPGAARIRKILRKGPSEVESAAPFA